MTKKIIPAIFMVICPLLLPAQSLKTIYKDAGWLDKHLHDKNLVIFHVDTKDNYDTGHIPGAQYISLGDFTTSTQDSIYREMPTTNNLDSLFRSYGVNNKSTILLYYGGDFFASVYRLYFTFDYLGMSKNVFILDGGLKNWNSLNMKTSTKIPEVKKSTEKLDFELNPNLIVSKDYVKNVVGSDNVKIIDARRDNFYSGEKDGDGHYKRPGHIGSAKNITWLNVIDDNQMIKSEKELQQYFSDQNIDKNDAVITYCHVGLRATVLYTVSKALGHNTKLYDGSYNEWDRLDDDYPVDYTYEK